MPIRAKGARRVTRPRGYTLLLRTHDSSNCLTIYEIFVSIPYNIESLHLCSGLDSELSS